MISNDGSRTAAREVACRIHNAALIAEAMDAGTWPTDAENLTWLARLVDSAACHALVAELEAVAA